MWPRATAAQTSGTPWPAALLTLPGPSLIPVLAATLHTSSESVPPVPKDGGGPDGHPACLSHLAQQSVHRLVDVMGRRTPGGSPAQMPVLCREDANPAGRSTSLSPVGRGLEEAHPYKERGFREWVWLLGLGPESAGSLLEGGSPAQGGFGSPTLGSSCVSRKGVTEQVTRSPCPPGWKGPCREHHMADKRPAGRTLGISQGRQPSWENHTWVCARAPQRAERKANSPRPALQRGSCALWPALPGV